MPTLEDKQAPQSAKVLVIGDSGSGKTGALAALANAGFTLRILDFDNGLDPLFTYVKDEFKKNVYFTSLQDRIIPGPQGVTLGKTDSLQRARQMMVDWKEDGVSHGGIGTWGPETVLVIDSLTFMGNAALRSEITVRGKTDQFKPKATKGHADPREIIGDAANDLEAIFATLYDERVKCHIILLSHIRNVGDHPFPSAVGATLPKVLGRYFNTLLVMEKTGSVRTLYTDKAGMPTKCPVKLPATLPISNGLATVVQAITRTTGSPTENDSAKQTVPTAKETK